MESLRTVKPKDYYDIAIIGGGINGVGIALDAATRGFSTILVDKGDFGNFTSSASTKLIHGGLRYLEYFEFPLVRESLRERERILRNAQHLVRPLKLNIPLYKHSQRSPLVIKMGMILYDLLSYDKSLPNHSMIFSNNRLKQFEPGIKHSDLKAIASYYDCIVEYPERLCLEIALSAEKAGALISNYSEVVECHPLNGKYQIKVNDLINNDSFEIQSKYLINAGGPFVDVINKMFNNKSLQRMMGGTKGSHIIIDRFTGGPVESLYIEAHQDGRPFFIIPWHNYYLVGTTDKFYEGKLEDVSIDEDEKDYLLKELNHFFPDNNFTGSDILYTYSGVRPLPYEEGKSERQVTRKHIIKDHTKAGLKNYISIIGGKLTTYRNLAEETIDLICENENIKRKSETRNLRLIGSEKITYLDAYTKSTVPEIANEYRLPEETVKYLVGFYGSRTRDVAELTLDDPELKNKLSDYANDIKAQVVFAVRKESARTLEDILIRRTGIGYSKYLGLDCLHEVADLAGRYLNWSDEQKLLEINKYQDKVNKFYQPGAETLGKMKEKENSDIIK